MNAAQSWDCDGSTVGDRLKEEEEGVDEEEKITDKNE